MEKQKNDYIFSVSEDVTHFFLLLVEERGGVRGCGVAANQEQTHELSESHIS